MTLPFLATLLPALRLRTLRRRGSALSGWLLAVLLGLGGAPCHAGEVRYMLWDSIQLPAYRHCAKDFSAQHPGVRIKFQQVGWNEYWTALSTGFIADSAPDVFVNHPTKFGEFARHGLMLDLAPLMARDRLDPAQYTDGLLPLWQRDGKQYGLPKDWDTVALMVNLAHAEKSGVSLAELQAMRWNPQDGGSFGQILKRLTRDEQGRNALDPAFDKRRVAVHGYQVAGAGGMLGQTEWSHFAVSNGFRYQDHAWSPRLHYDDPRLAATLDWMATLPATGVSAPYSFAKAMGAGALFVSGRAAIVAEGSWMVSYFARSAKFKHAWLPLPIGPTGQRTSMLNGLADSIWSGSRNKAEAWAWVRYMASPACQSVVASYGVLFPSIRGMAEQAIAAQTRQGLDTRAFLTMAQSHTFLAPMADKAAQIDDVMMLSIDAVLMGEQAATPALQQAAQRIRAVQAKR